MNDGHLLVENLIKYAEDKFALSETDAKFLRLRLYRSFGLDLNKIDKYVSRGQTKQLYELEDALREFIESSYTYDGNVKDLVSEVFGILSPLPSQIERSFKLLREKMGSKAAAEYFYDISRANAYVRTENFSELVSDGDSCVRISFSDRQRTGRERLDSDRRLMDDYRSVILQFGENDYEFFYQRYPDVSGEGELTRSDDKPFPLTRDAVDDALSFIDYLPQYALTSYFGGTATDGAPLIGGYLVSDKALPSYSCKIRSSVRSSFFPDADIAVCDYPVTGLSFVTFNRNAVVDFIYETVNAWNEYKDEGNGVSGIAKKGGNRSFFSVRILDDGRYAVQILFPKTDYFDLYEKREGLSSLFSDRSFARALFGDFVMDESAYRSFKYAKSFIEKKVGVNVEEHCPAFKEVLGGVSADNLFTTNSQKSSAILTEALVNSCVGFLSALSAFSDSDEGVFAFKKFLSSLDMI